MANLATQATAAIARPLKVLVPLIKEELARADENALECYRRSGELLQEAKWQVKQEGKSWGVWIKKNFNLSIRTAQVRMSYAGYIEFRAAFAEAQLNLADGNAKPASHSKRPEIRTLSDFVQPGRGSHQPAWFAPVQEATSKLNVERIRREYEDKLNESKIMRSLALQLIDIGFKVLATKLHPDKGGSSEAMSRLNEVKISLKSFAEEKWRNK